MKILHLANHCHEIGNGIMNVAVDLACEQARKGHTVMFASAGGSYVPLLERLGVRHFSVHQHWRTPAASLAGFLALRKIIVLEAPDIIHAHMMAGALMARALHPASDFTLVTTVHNHWQRSSTLMAVGDRVIAVSDAVRDAMAARGVDGAKLRTVRNGTVGSQRGKSSRNSAPQLARPAILTVCGMYQRKGVTELIEGFAAIADRYPTAKLYLAGDGPDRAAFEAQAGRTRFAQRIIFLGFVTEPGPLFAQADIFVLASRSEPFGLVLAEAREAGCAIVGTDSGGVAEVLEHGAAGILISPNDAPALSAALDRLLADDRLRSDLGQRAKQNLDWLTCARMAEETLAVYSDARIRHDREGAPRSHHFFFYPHARRN